MYIIYAEYILPIDTSRVFAHFLQYREHDMHSNKKKHVSLKFSFTVTGNTNSGFM